MTSDSTESLPSGPTQRRSPATARGRARGCQARKGAGYPRSSPRITYRAKGDDEASDAGTTKPTGRGSSADSEVEHIWDIAQTDGDPVPDVSPGLLEGEGPTELWDLIATQVAAAGYDLVRGTCTNPQANGETDPTSKTVTVRDDLSPAQSAKTLVHQLAHIRLGHVASMPSYQACRGRCEVEAVAAYSRVHRGRRRRR